MTSPTIVLLRHGETAWTIDGRHTGRTDVPLTEVGRHQAKLAGQRLRGHEWAAVLSSPLQRARETAELAGLGGAALCDDLVEWDYGADEGRRTADIRRERPGWSLFVDGVPGGETLADVSRRADRVIERVRDLDGDAVLVAHGHVLRVLGARWVGLDGRWGASLALAPASLSALGFERETPVLLRWNDTAHLESGWHFDDSD
jgi:broad specificity phosphatase PhoE